MAARTQIILFVLIFNFIVNINEAGKVLVKRYENCEQNDNYKVKVNATFKTVGDKQYMDGILIITEPIDNHIKINVTVEMLVIKQYAYLLSVYERKGCDALNKYFGEFLYDIERNAQIIPGLCPIEKGTYHLHNYLLDFDKMTTVNNFPFGNLRATVMSYTIKNSVYTCAIVEVENRI